MKKAAFFVLAAILAITFTGVSYAADKPEEGAEQTKVMPKKVQVDTNSDGKPDRTEYYDVDGKIVKIEMDANGDEIIDETIIYEGGKPVKSVKDTNNDGKPDVWIDF